MVLTAAKDSRTPEEPPCEAAYHLEFYQAKCGMCMNSPALLICATRGQELIARDDRKFALLLRHMRNGVWDNDPAVHLKCILRLPTQKQITPRAVWRAMRDSASDVLAYHDILFRIITAMP